MNSGRPLPSPTSDPAPDHAAGCACCDDAAAARARRRVEVLQELIEMGIELTRVVQGQAMEQAAAIKAGSPEPESPSRDHRLAFTRIVKAVQRTLALAERIDEDRKARDARRAAEEAKRLAEADRVHRQRRKRRVRRAVERSVMAQTDGNVAAFLLAEIDERLEDDEFTEFDQMPIGEIVARIVIDLGLTIDLSLWQDEDWAIEEQETKPPGSPYADHVPAASDPDRPATPSPPIAASGRDPP